jgi:hypothetical protein
MSMPRGNQPVDRDTGSATERWGRSSAIAAAVLVVAVVGFVVVPDRLLAFLSTRTAPRTRDALLVLYVVVFFIAISWLFVRVQREEAE